MLFVDFLHVVCAEKIEEIFERTAHHCGKPHILIDVVHDERDVLDVRFAEIDVVIDERTGLVGLLYEWSYHIADDGIDSEKRTEEQHIPSFDGGKAWLYAGVCMVLIEFVARIVMVIEESQRYM